jgi:penicillin amidase
MLDLDRASNWNEFLAALARYPGPGQNFVYADAQGNIGYHATGLLPIRRNYDGDVPVDGSSGDYEWNGYIPFEQLPQAYNPPSGLIVTANQSPFPADYPFRVHGNFAAPYRADRIEALLTRRGKWKAWDMLGVQMDVYSSFGHLLARDIVEAYGRRGVRGGDGEMRSRSCAPGTAGWSGAAPPRSSSVSPTSTCGRR